MQRIERKKGFTLIELLVVIAIIGLLLSILLPALMRMKAIAWRMICATDQRGFVEAYRSYSEQWDGRIPIGEANGAGNWFWDISYYNTDLMLAAGMLPKNFYCPSIKSKWPPPPWGKDTRFWRWSEWNPNEPPNQEPTGSGRRNQFRVCGIISLIDIDMPNDDLGYGDYRDRPNDLSARQWRRQDMISTNPHKEWLENINKLRNVGDYELVVDALVTTSSPITLADKKTYTWYGIQGGSWTKWEMTDDSNHMDRRYVPEGTNVGFADGHVAWRKLEEVHGWFQAGAPYFWY